MSYSLDLSGSSSWDGVLLEEYSNVSDTSDNYNLVYIVVVISAICVIAIISSYSKSKKPSEVNLSKDATISSISSQV
jgi:hypothetical protein